MIVFIPGGDVVAAGPMAVLASLFLSFVARIKEKIFPHQGLENFSNCVAWQAWQTSVPTYVAGVSLADSFSRLFGGFLFRRPSGWVIPKKSTPANVTKENRLVISPVRCNPKL